MVLCSGFTSSTQGFQFLRFFGNACSFLIFDGSHENGCGVESHGGFGSLFPAG